MDSSAISAFSNVDVEDGEVVFVSEATDRSSAEMNNVHFPDVFSTPSKGELIASEISPRPSTPKFDNTANAMLKSSSSIDSNVHDDDDETDTIPTDEMDSSPAPPSLSSGGAQGGDKDEPKALRDLVPPPSSISSSTLKTVVSTLRESVQPGVSNRADFTLVPSKVALLIIDIQDFLSAPSSAEEEERNAYLFRTSLPRVVSNVSKFLEQMRPQRDALEQGCEVIFSYLEALTVDCRDVSLDYKLSGPQLAHLPTSPVSPATFLPALTPQPGDGKGDILIPKTSCSVFMSTNLHYVLQNMHIEQLVICGQLTDQCVESAVRDAADLGYFVTVVEDACAAQSEASHAKGLSGMRGFSRIRSTQQVLEELRNPQVEQLLMRVVPPSTVVERGELVSTDAVPTRVMDDKPDICIASVADYSLSADFSRSRDASTSIALLRALQFAGIQFVRFMAVDAYNSIRCKAVPLENLIKDSDLIHHVVAIAEVCFAGLPIYGDSIVQETGLDARKVLTLHPDLGTLRVLPYAPKTAVVMGAAHEVGREDASLSPLCTRGLLERVIKTAEEDYGIAFNVGAELEFCIFDSSSNDPVDQSVFGNATTLNQQESFISDLYTQLCQQHISVSQIHAESASGQLEVVLEYQKDPLVLVDHVVLARETILAVATAHQRRAVFLPKVFSDQAGSGCHLHLSFRRTSGTPMNKNNAFPHANLPNEVSAEGKSFLEGILQHLPALLAVSMPTQNSFRRVGPGCWTGSRIGWAVEDKESPLRVCVDPANSQEFSNVEYKVCDNTANLYLCLACILGCGLNGIVQRLSLRPPLSSSCADSRSDGDALPSTLMESLQCLRDSTFLMALMGPTLGHAYVAVRQTEAEQASDVSLEEEVKQALQKC